MGKFIRGFFGGIGCLWLVLVVFLGVGGSFLARNPGFLMGESLMVESEISTSPGRMNEQLKEMQAEDCEQARRDSQRIWDNALDEGRLDDDVTERRLEQAEQQVARECRGQ